MKSQTRPCRTISLMTSDFDAERTPDVLRGRAESMRESGAAAADLRKLIYWPLRF